MSIPEIFYGVDNLLRPIHHFFQQLEIHFECKGIPHSRRYPILVALLGDPALQEFTAAVADGTIANPNIPAEPALAEAAHLARYVARKEWLINRYHGVEEQAAIRAELSSTKMELGESPSTFYARIATL